MIMESAVDPSGGSGGYRRYTREEKERLLALVDSTGNVTRSAAELGLNLSTCYGWVRAAGIAVKQGGPQHPGRDEYFRLRSGGLSARAAAEAVGVHRRTVRDWDQGIRHSGRRRVRPGEREVDYNGEMNTMAAPDSVTLAALETPINRRYLGLQERETIRDLLAAGASIRAVARTLGRSPSTISREVARNQDLQQHYRPYAAQRKAVSRRTRPKESKLRLEGPLRGYVRDKLLIRWSPEQISRSLVRDFPDDPEMRVSHETIYQAIYLQPRGGLRREVASALRSGRARRAPHTRGQERRPRFIDPMIMISERPPEIEDRAVPGHWEGDLITGTANQSAIATLVERSTRYVMLVHLPGDHTAATVRDGLVKTMATLPSHLRGSLTWDQGVEMAGHRSFTIATDIPVYFCDPASPWQRGSNENTNGLLRQYFPKGTDLSVYGPEDLEHVAQELNGRPRKTLGWDTPAERLRDLLLTN